jgi:ribonuclease J
VKLTIHRGASEIGGSCVEIATDCTRIILDVGAPLDEVSAEQRLPKVGGLFGAGDRIDAILLSHAHLDHSGLLSETTSSVPVYLTTGASKMLLASALYGAGKQVERSRQRTVAPGEEVTIGDLKVMFHPVDHSVYGSTAIRVEADGKRILYSGDLRLHGRKPGMAKSLIAFAKAHPIDLLLMEGTNLGQSKKSTITELEVEDALLKLFRESASLVLCFFSPQNLDRLVSFYKAARKNGRTFVADRYTAAIMYLLHTEVRIPMPSAKAGIRVYFNSVGRKCQKIEKHFRNAAITWDEIASSPDDYVMIARLPILDASCVGSFRSGRLEFFDVEWISRPPRMDQSSRADRKLAG